MSHLVTTLTSNRFNTCDRCLDVQYGFLLTQDTCSLADDSKRHSLLHTALLGEVGLQEIHTGLPFAVKHFLHRKAVAQGEGDSWGQSTGTWWHLNRGDITVTMATVNAIENTILDSVLVFFCTSALYRQHIIKEFMQKSYLRKPHPCFACRHCCAATASIFVDLQYICGMKTIFMNMAVLNMQRHNKVWEAICRFKLNRK